MHDIIFGLIFVIGLVLLGGFLVWLGILNKPDSGGIVPDIKSPPGIPMYTPSRTINTKYGKDLLDIATKIYLEKAQIYTIPVDDKARESVKEAHNLLISAEEHCNKIDESIRKKSAKETEKMIKEMSRL